MILESGGRLKVFNFVTSLGWNVPYSFNRSSSFMELGYPWLGICCI